MNFKKHPEYLKMEPKKQEMVSLLADTLTGKNLTEALPFLVQWKKQMQNEGLSFTPEENQILTNLFMEQMTPAQRKQYEFLKPFIKN